MSALLTPFTLVIVSRRPAVKGDPSKNGHGSLLKQEWKGYNLGAGPFWQGRGFGDFPGRRWG